MNEAEIKTVVEEWRKRRGPCPLRPPSGKCEDCHFWVPSKRQKSVDPQIAIVGQAPPPDFTVGWMCVLDLMSMEVTTVHAIVGQMEALLVNFLSMMQEAANEVAGGPR